MKKVLLAVLVSLGLQTQAQQAVPYFCCDSITYWIDQSQGFNIGLDTTNIVHNPDSIDVIWGVCTYPNGMCYSGQGMYYYFSQITVHDTIKVSYSVSIYENGSVEYCNIEDWLVFDQNSFSWVLINMVPTNIEELEIKAIGNKKIYDLQGRELKEVPVGVMYIRNNKLYIKLNKEK